MRRVLMVAFHFPPLQGSSGIQRTLSLCRYLPNLGWQPVVLSANPRAYRRSSDSQLGDIPEQAIVERAFALDSARHLSIAGRYLLYAALPDAWCTWFLGAVPKGMAMIRRYKPDLIWSTYPISTAHAIGWALSRMSGLPWIADLRDPMVESNYPRNPSERSARLWVEKRVVRRAHFTTCAARGTCRKYIARYPDVPADRFRLIENGYDESMFCDLAESAPASGPLTVVHSGLVYPNERDPTALFDALSLLRRDGVVAPEKFRIIFRAGGNEEKYREMLTERGIEGLVQFGAGVPYREALNEMMRVDGLLVIQAGNCNDQIPAKVYEYFRARRPILALTDPAGDTADVIRRAGIETIMRWNQAQDIADGLRRFILDERFRASLIASEASVQASSRQSRAEQFAELFDQVRTDSGISPAT